MNMDHLERNLWSELEEVSKKPLSSSSMDAIYTLTATIKNLLKIEMLEEAKDEYEEEKDSKKRKPYYGYDHRESRESVISNLEEVMHKAESEKEREAIEKCLHTIKNM